MKQFLEARTRLVPSSLINFFTLFGSLSTLVCCALPALLVSIGLGATMASLATNIPGLIWLSEHKNQVFILVALVLTISGFLILKNRNLPCPIDPKLRNACLKGRRLSQTAYLTSLIVFAIGVFFAYIAPRLNS